MTDPDTGAFIWERCSSFVRPRSLTRSRSVTSDKFDHKSLYLQSFRRKSAKNTTNTDAPALPANCKIAARATEAGYPNRGSP